MQAIKVQIYFSEWEKVSDFISEINIDEEMAAYAIDNRTMVIATVGECSMAYAKAQLKTWFSDPTGKSSVSCPLKPSDSAPLKHSTMPP